MSDKPLTCFKSYDVRGKLGLEFNEDIAYRIGRASTQLLRAKSVVIGFDARETSSNLSNSVIAGICDAGADALKIGLAGSEEMYCAVHELNADAGIEVTASHNPIDYNGMKIVKYGARSLTEDEFHDIKLIAEGNNFLCKKSKGSVFKKDQEARSAYMQKILGFIDLKVLKPLKIVINSGNGAAGPVVDGLHEKLEDNGIRSDFVFVDHKPDHTFPNGIPNPLLYENRSFTADVVKSESADFGVAFDGDFDRCFLFDNYGNFIPGEYLVGLLAKVFLEKDKGATILHDPRVTWNTLDLVKKCGGFGMASKTGHVYFKKAMREENAIYGGEMSAHHYFRDFFYCDSGMVPWLLVWELLSKENKSLSDLVDDRRRLFPSSGEINFKVSDTSKCLKVVKDLYSPSASEIDEVDGLSITYSDWRFNLRRSNTESLIRLNIETQGDPKLLTEKIKELTYLINVM